VIQAILVGTNGEVMKKIIAESTPELEQMFAKRISLHLKVKCK